MWPFGGSKKADEAGETMDPAAFKAQETKSAKETAGSLFADEAADESSRAEVGSLPAFDAKALERAAKAAKELEGLKFAGEAITIAKLKEDRRAKQAIAEAEQSKVQQKAMEVERTRAQEAERRQTLQQEHKMQQEQAYYQDQLSRKRHQDQLAAQRQMREQQLKREEDFQLRVEGMKRQTAEYEAKLRKDTERARVQAEMEGKADQERKNWDLHMQRSQMEARELRSTVLQSVKEAGTMIGNGFNSYMEDKQKLATTVGLFTMVAVGIYGARSTTAVLGRFVEARLGKPPLVRETSRTTVLNPIKTLKSLVGSRGAALDGVVVEPKLRDRLSTLSISTSNTKKNGAPYRHAMLYGPPGTGKTLFAKKLAASSGMDYAILTGGDVAPLGRDAVTEIHKLFDWAGTSRKGLLVFVDEADAFLRKRSEGGMSEDQRNALNAFLYRTGTESRKFMVVYATNEPEQLDWAVNDRTDELIRFELPGVDERKKMLQFYFDKYVANAHETAGGGMFSGPERIKIDGVDESLLDKVAERTNGYSGREIAKLAIGWQAAAYGSENATLTKSLFDKVLDNSLEQHVQKLEWESERK